MAQQVYTPKKYINVYLCLGSNEGNRLVNIRAAAELIHKNIGKIARKTHMYETQPWGQKDQEVFYNQIIMINTSLEPSDLLTALNKVERELGRERKEKWGPAPSTSTFFFTENGSCAPKTSTSHTPKSPNVRLCSSP